VGLAAAISTTFSEGLSDDGLLTGLMTTIGGLGHTLPLLLATLQSALIVDYFVVGIELVTIAFIRNRYFSVSFGLSDIQVVTGGSPAFANCVLIGTN